MPTCQIHLKYPWIKCTEAALHGDSDLYCILHSQNKDKDSVAFKKALKIRWKQESSEFIDFRGIFFPHIFVPSDYGLYYFKKRVDFSNSTFAEGGNFSSTSLTETDGYCDVSFGGFSDEADFSGVRIEGRMVFRSVSKWKREYLLNYAIIFNDTREMIHDELLHWKPPAFFQGKFIDIEFGQGAVLLFQDLSLAKVLLTGTDLRKVEFHHVTWHPYRGRQAIYDEVLLRHEEKKIPWFWRWLFQNGPFAELPSVWTDSYGEVECLYRDLQENYEKVRDYKKMGDFHYGELEMHRRASKWRWFPFYWYNLYRVLNGYGERPSWALGWLFVFLAVFTALLAWAGLEILDPKYSAGFGNPFFYLLQKVTLQRPTWAEPLGFGGKLVAGFSVLLIPGQAALFLLALRNRLGRRR